jgi:hypothetical protein
MRLRSSTQHEACIGGQTLELQLHSWLENASLGRFSFVSAPAKTVPLGNLANFDAQRNEIWMLLLLPEIFA